jgi:methionine-rich copper-binding protein CopC
MMRIIFAASVGLLMSGSALAAHSQFVIINQNVTMEQNFTMVASTPVPNEALGAMPPLVTLNFSAAPIPGQASIRLYDPYNHAIDLGSIAVNANSVTGRIPVMAEFAKGAYKVEWSATCSCDIPNRDQSGSYYFTLQ